MIGQMRAQQRGVAELAGFLQACRGERERIALHRIETLVAGGCGQQQHHFIGTLDTQTVAHRGDAATLDLGHHAQCKAQLAVDAGEAAIVTTEQQAALLHRDLAALRAVDAHPQRNATRPIAGQTHHDALRLRRHEHLAPVHRAAGAERGGGHCGIQIELTTVLTDAVGTVEIQQQIAQRLVRHLLERTRQQLGIGQLLGLCIAAGKDQRAHLRQRRQRLRIGGVVRTTGIQRVFVELQTLVGDAAPHHRAQPTVADRQGLHPFISRLAIPQVQGIVRGDRRQWCNASCLRQRRSGTQDRDCGPGCLAEFSACQHGDHRAASPELRACALRRSGICTLIVERQPAIIDDALCQTQSCAATR